MPRVELVYFREEDGSVPLIEWLDSLDREARQRCAKRLALLAEKGHELRRPHAENLADGIYELRLKSFRLNFRMLYFFHGRTAAVVSHGFSKEARVPPEEIAKAVERMRTFLADPERHSYSGGPRRGT